MTQINFSNITGEIKFIDSLKYYQKSLSELASTVSDEERAAIRKLTEQFFNQHYYFSRVWPYLNSKKKQVLEIVSEGKGVIPYELIIDMDSFFFNSGKWFLGKKTEFYSELKQSAVNDIDYENSKYFIKL